MEQMDSRRATKLIVLTIWSFNSPYAAEVALAFGRSPGQWHRERRSIPASHAHDTDRVPNANPDGYTLLFTPAAPLQPAGQERLSPALRDVA